MSPRNALALRLGTSILLSGAVLVLYFLTKKQVPPPALPEPGRAESTIVQIDRNIDSVLHRFGIESEKINKRSLPVPNTTLARTERRVIIPPDIVPVMVNAALNTMARQFNARAVASEDTKLNTVTIHIEFSGTIIHTIILKTDRHLARKKPERTPVKI